MKVESVHPGVTRDQIVENTGFELMWADQVKVSLEPEEQELRILREEVDPLRYIIGKEAI